ncbi:hypothetical protein FSP39_021932 [Pinctada imbricata]|uniref:Beta-lactamase-related domain-containing protein n=1 Tax=Pinctada imbricata TaxID=66713 RepID=A0AA88YMC5_PINIB|nr:hypothetical protein FSP39_021932 [Pinctada imbricata]
METVDLLLITGYPDNIANRKIISQRLRNMETIAPFREEFIYNNLMYMTAGHVAEILGGASFEELIRSRIFKPLNMTDASFMADLDFNQNVARPYDKENDTLLESDTYLYRVHSLSPAGTVCASPRDYSKWLMFLLSNATTIDGERLIEDSLWRDMWKGRQYIGDAAETSYNLYKPFPYFRSASSYATAWFRSNYRGHKVMFHSGSFHAYSALAVVHPNAKSAFMLTINGPWPLKFSNDVVPLSYVISDILLNETRWLEVSDACSFPSRWINVTSNHNRTIDVEKGYDNLTSENALMYIGRYGHPLKGEVDVYYNDGNLRAKTGFLTNVTFRYQPGNDTFDLTSDGSFQRVLNMYPTKVKFSELRNNVYNNMTLVSPRMKETHSFHRNINFDAVDSTETKSSKGSSFVCSILILLTCFVSSRCSFSSKMFDFVY